MGHCQGCCGKVNVMRCGRNKVGYILSEVGHQWLGQLSTNEIVQIPKVYLKWNGKGYKYPPLQHRNRRHYIITKYWPVRFLIHHTGDCRFTLNHLTLDKDSNIVTQHSS